MTRMVEGSAMPESIRRRTLSARTKVLPLPGPAITAQGPCPWQMALCWTGSALIVPEEADVVRQIYSWYLDGVGTGRIAIMLNAMRIPPCRGSLWNRTTIMSVLRNEKYTGNILLQKTFISDHLTKKKKVNRGELPQYYVEDSHEAIIDKSTFDKVQEELKRRAEQYETASSVVKERNPLAQKITCGI